MNVRRTGMYILEGMKRGIATAVERGKIAVAVGHPVLTHWHIGKIGVAHIEKHIGQERILVHIDHMHVNISTFLQVAVHVHIEITDNVHAFFGTFLGVGLASYESDFLGTPITINDGTMKLVATEQTCCLPNTCNTSGIVISTGGADGIGVGSIAVPRVVMRTANHVFFGFCQAPLNGKNVVGSFFREALFFDFEVVKHNRVETVKAIVTRCKPILYIINMATVATTVLVRAKMRNRGLDAVDGNRIH